MAKVYLKKDADPLQVAATLRKVGITLHRRTTDGGRVIYVNRRHYAQYLAWVESLQKGDPHETHDKTTV